MGSPSAPLVTRRSRVNTSQHSQLNLPYAYKISRREDYANPPFLLQSSSVTQRPRRLCASLTHAQRSIQFSSPFRRLLGRESSFNRGVKPSLCRADEVRGKSPKSDFAPKRRFTERVPTREGGEGREGALLLTQACDKMRWRPGAGVYPRKIRFPQKGRGELL